MAPPENPEQDSPEGAETARMWLFGIIRNVLNNSERGQRRRYRLASKLKSMLRADDSSHAADEGAEVRDAVRRLEPELGELVRLVPLGRLQCYRCRTDPRPTSLDCAGALSAGKGAPPHNPRHRHFTGPAALLSHTPSGEPTYSSWSGGVTGTP